jgi:hypothetical protein
MIAPPAPPRTESRPQTDTPPTPPAPSPFVIRSDRFFLLFCIGCFLLLFFLGLKDLLFGSFGLWRGQ